MLSPTQTGSFKRRVLSTTVLVLVWAPPLLARGQHGSQPVRPAPHSSAPRESQGRFNQNANPYRQAPVNQGRPSPYPQNGNRPAYPGTVGPALSGQPYSPAAPLGAQVRPYYRPNNTPPGHLGDWLNQHRGMPLQEQERVLRNDPNFYRLPQADQQRLLQQLHRVDQMPEAERQRRLARAELLERLSPQERMQINSSARRMSMLPADRRAMVTSAFRDLSAVPPEQRSTVLNSSRYQNQFSPDERGMLGDMLRVEPYEPAR